MSFCIKEHENRSYISSDFLLYASSLVNIFHILVNTHI